MMLSSICFASQILKIASSSLAIWSSKHPSFTIDAQRISSERRSHNAMRTSAPERIIRSICELEITIQDGGALWGVWWTVCQLVGQLGSLCQKLPVLWVTQAANRSHPVYRTKSQNHCGWDRFRSKVYPTRMPVTHHQSGQMYPTRSKRSGRDCREFGVALEKRSLWELETNLMHYISFDLFKYITVPHFGNDVTFLSVQFTHPVIVKHRVCIIEILQSLIDGGNNFGIVDEH